MSVANQNSSSPAEPLNSIHSNDLDIPAGNLTNLNIAIEMAIEIVNFDEFCHYNPLNMVIFNSYVNVYQRRSRVDLNLEVFVAPSPATEPICAIRSGSPAESCGKGCGLM